MRFKIAQTTEIQEGQIRQFIFNEAEILIINLKGIFYCLAGRCTHAGAPLVEGTINGNILTCPWHGSQFKITDGTVIRGPAEESLQHYSLTIESNYIFIIDAV